MAKGTREMTILKIKNGTRAENLLNRRRHSKIIYDDLLESHVKDIIKAVQTEGDLALTSFTKEFDNVDLDTKGIKISEREILDAYRNVRTDEIKALKDLKMKLENVERCKLKQMNYLIDESGLKIHHQLRPIQSIGCYVPGGEAAYSSSLLMTTVPAKIAGVPRIVICSPPTYNGDINPLILVAASICEVDEIYRLGGAQAIAALAYGTESIKPVVKIVGPGNKYVLLAKVIVSKDVAIDHPSGPSEILVLADETAEPRLVAFDLISQSEHAPDNVAGLVTTSKKLALEVIDEVERLIPSLERASIVSKALSNNGFIYLCRNIEEAINFVNAFGPEHLEIVTRKPSKVAEKINSSGIILLGKYTPVSASDYCFGTNHVLPTAGFSHIYSGLSIFDYVKMVNIVCCSRDKLGKLRSLAKTFANSEGLPNHYVAIEERFKEV